jgi:hypothetical protein
LHQLLLNDIIQPKIFYNSSQFESKPMKELLFAAVIGLTASAATSSASADVLFSDFGANNSFSPLGFIVGTIPFPPYSQVVTAPFLAAKTGAVTDIDVALGNLSGTNSAIVSLWTSSGNVPDVELGHWIVSGQPATGTTYAPTEVSGIDDIVLTAGSEYAVEIAGGDDTTMDVWGLNIVGASQPPVPGSGSFSLPAFDVIGTAVPEPMSLALLVSGIAPVLLRRRQIRGARR